MYKLRTVDVWDTLLRRDCHPECIKLSTALHIHLRFYPELANRYRDHWEIYRCRLDIESSLGKAARARGEDDEYAIDKVAAAWLSQILNREPRRAEIDDILEYELQTEIARSFPDEDIVRFLKRHQAEKTIFLSDFYMTGTMLQRLLHSKGLSELVSDGLSSCDIGKNKRSGNLFQHVHAAYDIHPTEHFHVGDNLHSDVAAPRNLGISAEHFLPEKAHEKRLAREMLFTSRNALFDHVRQETLLASNETIHGLSEEQAIAFRLGLDAAPLFIGFAMYVAEQALLTKQQEICFLTREGEFFHQVYTALHDKGTYFGHALPRSSVLEVSRLSTFAASMETISVAELQRIWRLYRTQKVGGLFATLGLKWEDFAALLATITLSPEDVIEQPESDTRLAQLLSAPQFQAAASATIQSKKQLLKDYVAAKGVVTRGSVGLVDIGWRGTIQDNIALVFPDTEFQGCYLGLRPMVNPQPRNVIKHAYCVDERSDANAANYFEAFAALEMLCGSPNGSVEGYERKGGSIVASRNVSEQENRSYFGFTKFFQQGVLAAVDVWQPYAERYAMSSGDLRETALHIWKRLANTPPESMVDAFVNAPQHDVFGFGDFYHRNNVPSLQTIAAGVIKRRARREVIEFVQRVQWTSAIRGMKGIGRAHRSVLTLVFMAAHVVKKVRRRAHMRGKK